MFTYFHGSWRIYIQKWKAFFRISLHQRKKKTSNKVAEQLSREFTTFPGGASGIKGVLSSA